MTIKLFIVLFTIGSMFSSLFTQALKKAFANISSNVLALYGAVIVGGFGMIGYYVINAIDFTPTNIIYAVLMVICIWMGSMVGYDKVLQLIAQVTGEDEYE